MEIHIMTSNDNKHNIILRNFINALNQYKKKVKGAGEMIDNKTKLESILISKKENQKEKLINNEELAWNQFEKLERAKRQSYEMESISIDVAKELNKHTEKLYDVKDKLKDMNSEISSSNSLISRMLRREYRNKIVLVMFTIALILIFLTIIYFKLFNSSSKPKTQVSDAIEAQKKFFKV